MLYTYTLSEKLKIKFIVCAVTVKKLKIPQVPGRAGSDGSFDMVITP